MPETTSKEMAGVRRSTKKTRARSIHNSDGVLLGRYEQRDIQSVSTAMNVERLRAKRLRAHGL